MDETCSMHWIKIVSNVSVVQSERKSLFERNIYLEEHINIIVTKRGTAE